MLDQIAEEVETAVASEPTFGGLASFCDLRETETELTDEQEQPTGLLTMRFAARYRVDGQAPGTIID